MFTNYVVSQKIIFLLLKKFTSHQSLKQIKLQQKGIAH